MGCAGSPGPGTHFGETKPHYQGLLVPPARGSRWSPGLLPDPAQPLTHPPGPAVRLAAGSPPGKCVRGTRAGYGGWLGSGEKMLVIRGRHLGPQPRLLRVAMQPILGTRDDHPPALRLEPEDGVGRLRRWLVFFCSGGHGSQGAVGIRHLPKPSSSLLLHESPLGGGTADTQMHADPYPPGLGLLHGSTQSLPGVLNDTPSLAREVHGY